VVRGGGSGHGTSKGGEGKLLTSSVTRVQFMVQSKGIHLPVASQKGAMAPVLSTIGVSEAPKRVPAGQNHSQQDCRKSLLADDCFLACNCAHLS